MHKIKITNQNVKILNFVLLFWILIFGFWISCYAQDKIVAIVNDEVITQKDLNDFINFTRLQLQSEYKRGELEKKIESLKAELLDKLIEDRLILQEAKKNKIIADGNRAKARINEIKNQYNSDGEFQEALREQGLVQADIESRIKEQMLMYNIIDLKVRSGITVNPTEVTDFYNRHEEEFFSPELREFESISVEGASLAKELYDFLKNAGDLDDVAKKYSLQVAKMSVSKGREVRKEIEEAVFKLKAGEVSVPLAIEGAYYIFKLKNIILPRKQVLSEVQDNIYQFLFNQKMQEELINWLGELKKHSYIKIMQD